MEAVLLGLQSRIRMGFGAAWAPREAVVLTMEFERRIRFDVGDVSVDEGWDCCFCCAATTCALVGMSKGMPVCDIVI